MTVDPMVLNALSTALADLGDKPHRPIPASVIEALAPLAKQGMHLKVDLNACKAIGAPLVTMRETNTTEDLLSGLTKRQKEGAKLVIKGCSNRQIAGELGISSATVKDHVHAILSRLDLESRVALIAASYDPSST